MARPEQLRIASRARAEGRTFDEIAALPGMPTKRAILRWQEAGLIPDHVEEPLLGTDVLVSLLLDPSTTQGVRAKAAADLERLRLASDPGTDPDAPSRVVNVVFDGLGFCERCTCTSCTDHYAPTQAMHDLCRAPDTCLNPHVHAITNGHGRPRECGCPS